MTKTESREVTEARKRMEDAQAAYYASADDADYAVYRAALEDYREITGFKRKIGK